LPAAPMMIPFRSASTHKYLPLIPIVGSAVARLEFRVWVVTNVTTILILCVCRTKTWPLSSNWRVFVT
jgi:hypothetical protein